MARPRNKRPNFVSIDIIRLGQIVMSKNDDHELAEWVRKASKDLLIGCVGDNVDEDVKAAYNDAFDAMVKTQERKRELHEKKKQSKSTDVVPVNGSKRNDQLIWGRFENVYLSQDEYNTLLQDFGNLNFLKETIEAFSASLSDGHTTSNNHFATLTRWIAYRKQMAEKEENRPHYESVTEHNRRILEQSRRETQLLKEQGYLK